MCDETMGGPRVLSRVDGLGSVTVCGCGTLSLHLGGVSVRMDAETFAQAVGMCREAMVAVEMQAHGLTVGEVRKRSLMTH